MANAATSNQVFILHIATGVFFLLLLGSTIHTCFKIEKLTERLEKAGVIAPLPDSAGAKP